jgi:hypothetical protein
MFSSINFSPFFQEKDDGGEEESHEGQPDAEFRLRTDHDHVRDIIGTPD